MMNTNDNVYKRKSQDFFNESAASYDQSTSMGISPELLSGILQKLTRFPQPQSILDVGCGTGELLTQITGRMDASLAGLDLSPNMVAVARKKLGNSVDLQVGDSEALPWEAATFSVVLCTLSFHHYPHPNQALTEMRRVLKPGGMLILADMTMPTPLRQFANLILPLLSTGDHRFYSQAEILGLLTEAGFLIPNWQKVSDSTFFVTACLP